MALAAPVGEEELALVDGGEPAARGAEDQDGPLDLHAALAQIGAQAEDALSQEEFASGSEAGGATSPRAPSQEPGPPGGGARGGGAGESGEEDLEPAAARVARRVKEPPLPCRTWLAVGGVHDAEAPLVRVANDDLQEAALRGDLGLVRRLIRAGASVNAPMRPECEEEFMSLLHVLSLKPEMPNGSRIVAEIIHKEGNLNVRSSLGTTPLMCACLAKHTGAVEVLLEAGADPSPMDDYGRTAGCCAVMSAEGGEVAEMPPQEEALAVEVVEMLASKDADLSNGAGDPPIVHAVRRASDRLVVALLEGGAEPDGLHAAVEAGPVSIIRALVGAEANPFTKDADGKNVMDLALARGDEEITTLLRNYVGDLQRQQHRHLRTLEEQMEAEAAGEDGFLRNPSGNFGARRSMQQQPPDNPAQRYVEETALSRCKERLQIVCRKINRNGVFQVAMFMCLLAALLLPDLWVLLDITSSAVLDLLLVAILAAFVAEFLVQAVGLSRSYACSFFFWMDLVGIVSVPLDHSLVMNALPSSFDNAVVMRAARMAKLGARAGRFTKLVKLLRFLPGFQDQASAGTAKCISGKLNVALSTRISCLIIMVVMLLPLFDLITHPNSDYSMRVWAEELGEVAARAPEALPLLIADIEAFYAEISHFPYEAEYTFGNGSRAARALSRRAPPRERSRVRIADTGGGAALLFSFRGPQQIDALCNCLLIVSIMLLMIGSSLVLTSSVSSIVLVPLELLLSNVQKVASKIFSSVASMSGRAGREEDADKDEAAEEEGGFGNETLVLERVLLKIAAVSEITAKKTPLDADTFNRLHEGDRALLQGYSGGPQEEARQSAAVPPAQGEQERLLEEMSESLVVAGVSWEDFDSWDFNVLDLPPQAQLCVCHGVLAYHHGGAGHASARDPEWSARVVAFTEAAARGYGSPEEVPYHNWAHATDTCFTLFRLFGVCQAEHFLGAHERFALVVGAIGHDIGHPGLNDAFLVETGHELALRYNDQSPLEHMHCARLFEITRQPEAAIFAGLQRAQYSEVRRVCIGAVLHTDYQRHFGLVKETQTLHEMNAELFDAAEELYYGAAADFPSREVAEFFCTADVKAHLHHVLLHFCDVSNPMRARPLCEAWAYMIIDEFFQQGDRERSLGLPVQPLNDRGKVNLAYSQIAFIEYFVAPMALGMCRLMPPLDCLTETLLENMELWFECWAEETQPPPDAGQQDRVRERIGKLLARWSLEAP